MDTLFYIVWGIFGLLLAVAPQKVLKKSALENIMSRTGFGLMFVRVMGVLLVLCGIFAIVVELYV